MPKKKKVVKKILMKTKPKKVGKVLVVKKKVKMKKPKVLNKKNIKAGKKIIKKITKKTVSKSLVKVMAKKVVKKSPIKKIVKIVKKKSVEKKISVPKLKPLKIKKIVTKKHSIKKLKSKPNEGFAAESLFRAKIKVIGVGGGGGSIVSEIGRSLEKATFVVADTDIRALKKRNGMKYFWFGEEFTHGLGTGVNVDLAKQAAESAKEKMSGYFKDQDIIIFVASLGGGLGSGATQVFAEAARNFGGITFGIFTMPFKFEGKNKQKIAQNALKSLRKSLNVSLVIPNEKIFKIIDESTPIVNAFSTVNKSLIESLESLIDLIYSPGVINIDFADLRTILRGRGNLAFLNTIEASGKDGVEKICENIFKNPLLQVGSFKTEKILFNIAGGDGLSMFQVEKISRHISDSNQKAKIIFGISKNSKLKNKIKTTILMTGASPDSQDEEEIIVPTKSRILDEVAKKEELIEPVVADLPVIVEKIKESAKKEIKIVAKEEKKHVVFKEKKQKSINAKKVKKPILNIPVSSKKPITMPVFKSNKAEAVEVVSEITDKKTIRRSGLEIKEAEELQEKKRIAQEKEWEIPAFLRKVKFKS